MPRLPTLPAACSGLAALLLTLALPSPAAPPRRPPLTVEQIVARSPALSGTAPAGPAWSPDGALLAFTWSDQALPSRDLWLVARDGAGLRQRTRSAATPGPAGQAALPGAVAAFVWLPDGALAVLAGGDLYRLPADGSAPLRLTTSGGDKGDLSRTPDGGSLAFLRDGDLFLVPAAGGREVRLTEVGRPPIGKVPLGTYYRPDIEIGSGDWGDGTPYAFSPDGKTVAVHHVDRTQVRRFPIPHYLGPEAVLNELRRGAPGEVNERRTLGLVDVASRTLRLLPLPEPERWRVISFFWSRKGALVIDRETDDAVDRSLVVTDAAGSPARELWRDHGEHRIYNDTASALGPDGESALVTGDLDDRYRLYRLPLDGKGQGLRVGPGLPAPAALTPGPSDVEGPALASPASGEWYYKSSAPRPEDRQVWRGRPGAAPVQVTTRPGSHTPFPSPDGRTLALLSSDDVSPPELWLREVASGKEQRITRSPPPAFEAGAWVQPRYLAFKGAAAGLDLHLRLLEPAGRAPGQRSPVIFGPVYSNRVRNRWSGLWSLLEQLLVQRGYVVAQLDARGSTGYGRAFRERFLCDWGDGDLDDYADAAAFLKTLPGVDPARMGIFGSSYGGLITVYALLRRPGLFTAGVAGAPAVDARYYGSDDVAVARTPQSRPDCFAPKRAALFAGGLRDHLMILHGMADDVVPFQTSVQLAEELIKQGKEFDLVLAPGATHRWTAREADAVYLLGKLVAHFDRYLGGSDPWRHADSTCIDYSDHPRQ